MTAPVVVSNRPSRADLELVADQPFSASLLRREDDGVTPVDWPANVEAKVLRRTRAGTGGEVALFELTATVAADVLTLEAVEADVNLLAGIDGWWWIRDTDTGQVLFDGEVVCLARGRAGTSSITTGDTLTVVWPTGGGSGGGGGTVDVVSNVASGRILGRVTSGSGNSEELTPTQAKALLAIGQSDVTGLTAALAAKVEETFALGGALSGTLASPGINNGTVRSIVGGMAGAGMAYDSGTGELNFTDHTTFVFDSGGAQTGNRFNDWADLMAAMAAGPAGPKWLVIEQNETVPVGSWDLTDVILTTPRIIDWWLDGGVTLTFPEGATVSAWPFPYISNALALHNIGDPLLEVTATTCGAAEKGAVFASTDAPMFLVTGDGLTFSLTFLEEARLFNGTESTLNGPFGNPSLGNYEVVDDQGTGNVVALVQDASRITLANDVVRGGADGGVLAVLNYGVASARIDLTNTNYSGTVVPYEILNAAQARNLGVAATPANYTPASPDVEAHLAAIDTVLGSGGSGTVDVVSNVATSRILGRTTAGSGDSEELTAAQVRTLIDVDAGGARTAWSHPAGTTLNEPTTATSLLTSGTATLPDLAAGDTWTMHGWINFTQNSGASRNITITATFGATTLAVTASAVTASATSRFAKVKVDGICISPTSHIITLSWDYPSVVVGGSTTSTVDTTSAGTVIDLKVTTSAVTTTQTFQLVAAVLRVFRAAA